MVDHRVRKLNYSTYCLYKETAVDGKFAYFYVYFGDDLNKETLSVLAHFGSKLKSF